MSDGSVLFSRVMAEAIQKKFIRRGSFFRDKFFSEVKFFAERLGEYDIIDNTVHEIVFDGYDAEANSQQMNSWDSKTVKFECAKPGRIILPSDLQQRLPGYNPYEDDPQKIAELQKLSWEELEADLIYTEELMCLSGLKTGVISVKNSQGASKTLASWTPKTKTYATLDLSDEGKCVAWVMNLVQEVITNEGAAPNCLVVGAEIGEKIAGAFANGRRHAEDGNVNPALDYANECIAYLGAVAGVQIFVCGNSDLLGGKNAIIGSSGVNLMCYGPTFIPSSEGFTKVTGRRTMYSVVTNNPCAVKNILQSSPCPVVRRPADVCYVTITAWA